MDADAAKSAAGMQSKAQLSMAQHSTLTWPRLAAAMGIVSKVSNFSVSFPFRFRSMMATAAELSNAGTLSCSKQQPELLNRVLL